MALFNLEKNTSPEPEKNSAENASPEAKKPLFGNLFKEDPNKKESQKSEVFENIVEQKDAKTESKSVLGGLGLKKLKGFSPATALKEEILYKSVKIAFGFSLVLLLGVYGFFYTQVTPGVSILGTTSLQKWVDGLEKTQASYTEMIEKQLLLSEYSIQKFLTQSEAYTGAAENKAELKKELLVTFADVQKHLNYEEIPSAIRSHYSDPLAPAGDYQGALQRSIDGKIADLEAQLNNEETGEQLKSELRLDLSSFKSLQKRFEDPSFIDSIRSMNIEEGSFDGNIKKVTELINNFNKSDYAVIAQIQQKRINWSELIRTIEKYTRNVDLLYGSKEFGKIFYTSFNLAGDGISISGELNTKDSKNFSLMANLLDKLEKSKEFKDVVQNSFSKSKDTEGEEETVVSFSSSIVINFALQEGDDPRDAPITVATPAPTASATPSVAPKIPVTP